MTFEEIMGATPEEIQRRATVPGMQEFAMAKWQERYPRSMLASQVTLPDYLQFFPDGQCHWCGKPLTGRSKSWCKGEPNAHGYYRQACARAFYAYWWTRPKFQRAILIRDDFTCQACDVRPTKVIDDIERPDLSQLHVDHIKPVSKGGKTVEDNLQVICASCNLRKGNRPERLQRKQGSLL